MQCFYGQELRFHFFCSQLLVYKVFMGKSYLLIFSVGICWYTKFLWARVMYVLIFFCSQLLVYKVFMGKSYVLIFSVRSCWYTKFLWPRVAFSFFLLAVVGIQSYYGQELRSHFFCWQLLVYKFFGSKSYILIFSVCSCWYTKFLWARVTFSFFLLAVVGIQSFCEQELGSHFSCWQLLVYKVYGQELSSHFFLLAVVGIQSFYGQELSSHFFCWQFLVYKVFMGKSYVRSHFFCSQLLVYKVFMGKYYVLIFSVRSCWYTKFFMAKSCVLIFPVGSCWYTKLLWARVTFSFFLLAVVGIQIFCEQELHSHFFCSQLLVYKVFTGKSYVIIFSIGSCWYTKILWPRVIFSFFLLAVVGIQSFYGQELHSHFFLFAVVGIQSFLWARVTFSFFLLAVVGIQTFHDQELSSHFFCWQLLVYKVFMGKSYVFIFSVRSCWYIKFLWARVRFSFFLLAFVGIQSFYRQE